jgi:hypothetical protein
MPPRKSGHFNSLGISAALTKTGSTIRRAQPMLVNVFNKIAFARTRVDLLWLTGQARRSAAITLVDHSSENVFYSPILDDSIRRTL